MIQVPALGQEKVWLEKFKYDQAEKKFYEKLAKSQSQPTNKASNKQQQPQQQSSKKAAQISTTSKVDPKASGNKSNKTVKEQISVQPTPVVPQPTPSSTTAQPAKKTGEGNEAVTGNLTHESSGFFENEVSSTKSNKNIRTYKKEKEKKLTEEIFSSVTPATINPPAFQSQDIITPGPTPTPSDPSLITNKEHKKKKAKKERLRNPSKESKVTSVNNSLASEVAKARHHIKTSLQCIDDIADIATTAAVDEISVKVGALEKENSDLKHKVASLTDLVAKMEIRLNKLESGGKVTTSTSSQVPLVTGKPAPSKPQNNDDDDDDGVDLFGSDSDEDDAEAAKIKEQRLAEYAAKKSKKPALIAKSNIILDVKPWDDETDMKKMEQEVRKIEMDGLIWGASKLVPLAYGIHKLQISCVVEDDKVSVDLLQETMEAIGDYVQSVDIAAFNKV